MSSIDKLAIQGIRSFGPQDRDKQVIKIYSPLTLILGNNGTGKTTIIECLRNATTGDMPPSTGKGASFIHDPKLVHEVEVKGQIKLQFRDVRAGRKNVVNRSYVATQKGKTLSFQTKESSIKVMCPDGRYESITTRCADLNFTMLELLGVSKPILENVIFCHQTESNWPLSEGGELKKKFDSIFAATRYTQALEDIRKLRLEYAGNIKVINTELGYLQSNKDRAEAKQKEIKEEEVRKKASVEQIEQIRDQLKPIGQRLGEIETRERDIQQAERKLNIEGKELEYLRKNATDIRRNITSEYKGTLEQLKSEIENFKLNLVQQQQELSDKKEKRDYMKGEVEDLEMNHEKLLPKLGQLVAEEETFKKNVRQINEKALQLRNRFSLPIELDNDSFKKGKISLILDAMEKKVKEAQENFERVEKEFESKEENLQQTENSIRDEKSKLEQSCDSTEVRINENKEAIRKINKELAQSESYCLMIKEYVDEIEQLKMDLNSLEENFSVAEAKERIQVKKKEKKLIESKIAKLNSEMQEIQKVSSILAEIDLLKKDQAKREESVSRSIEFHKPKLMEVFKNIPDKDFGRKLEDFIKSKEQLMNESKKKISDKRSSISSLETKQHMLKDQLKMKEEEMRKSQASIVRVCGSDDLESSIIDLNNAIQDLQDEKGCLTGSEFMFKRYIGKLESEPKCPLCKRRFEEDRQVRALIKELHAKLKLIPNESKHKMQEIKIEQDKFNKMQELKGDQKKILELKNTIPSIKKEIDDTNNKILKFNEEITEEEFKLDDLATMVDCARSMRSDMGKLDQNLIELERIKRKISFESPKLRGHDSNRTMEVIFEELKTLQEELNSLGSAIEDCQQKIDEHVRYSASLFEVNKNKYELESKMQGESQLKEEKQKLTQDNSKLEELVKKKKGSLKGVNKRLDEVTKDKTKLLESKNVELDNLRLEISLRDSEKMEVQGIFHILQQYVEGGKVGQLERMKSHIQDLKSKIDLKNSDITLLDNKIAQLNEALTGARIQERNLKDNLELHSLKEKTLKQELIVAKLTEDMQNQNSNELYREKCKLQAQKDDLSNEIQHKEGRRVELEVNIGKLRRELNSSDLKDAQKKYLQKICEKHVKSTISDDLNKYYQALHYAVMEYHKQKMTEINKIIRDLWRAVYKGEDIDHIEIQSENDGTGLEKRRTYNYRVVMVKGDVAQDMRGRCSAGQKVLASLIIRLALAETFCVSCGILALDEPTTNLDRENIMSLAEALSRIVNTRCQQKNFQMIIITHDEEFIQHLARDISLVDHYYRISKDENGHSRITPCSLQSVL